MYYEDLKKTTEQFHVTSSSPHATTLADDQTDHRQRLEELQILWEWICSAVTSFCAISGCSNRHDTETEIILQTDKHQDKKTEIFYVINNWIFASQRISICRTYMPLKNLFFLLLVVDYCPCMLHVWIRTEVSRPWHYFVQLNDYSHFVQTFFVSSFPNELNYFYLSFFRR